MKLKIKLPKTGFEPITVSYKETVLPIKLFRLIIIIMVALFLKKCTSPTGVRCISLIY